MVMMMMMMMDDDDDGWWWWWWWWWWRWWMMMDDDGWWWMMMDDDGWWWMMMDDDGWWWMMMDDDGWWWMIMDDDVDDNDDDWWQWWQWWWWWWWWWCSSSYYKNCLCWATKKILLWPSPDNPWYASIQPQLRSWQTFWSLSSPRSWLVMQQKRNSWRGKPHVLAMFPVFAGDFLNFEVAKPPIFVGTQWCLNRCCKPPACREAMTAAMRCRRCKQCPQELDRETRDFSERTGFNHQKMGKFENQQASNGIKLIQPSINGKLWI